MRDPAISAGLGQFAAIQAVAPSLGVEVIPVNVRDPKEIERDVTAFARAPNGGMIVTGSPLAQFHRRLIANLAAQHKLPAVYIQRYFVESGGLISYSTTSVARASSIGGTSRPSALAVLRLIARSYFTGACTGRSAVLSPLRMRSTYPAARR